MKFYRFGHLDKNMVKFGERVKKGQQIGTIGNGNKWTAKNIINLLFNGKMSAHLHYDISNKEVKQDYVIGWSKAKVKAQYIDPYQDAKDEGYTFNDVTECDHLGWDWLDDIGNGYHPGVDLNGKGAGDTDFGNPIYSPIDGIVTYEWRGWTANKGWGNLIVIKENEELVCNHCCPIHCKN